MSWMNKRFPVTKRVASAVKVLREQSKLEGLHDIEEFIAHFKLCLNRIRANEESDPQYTHEVGYFEKELAPSILRKMLNDFGQSLEAHMEMIHQSGNEDARDYSASPEWDENWRRLTLNQASECARGFETYIMKIWRRAGPLKYVDWSNSDCETKKTQGFNWAALPARWILDTFYGFWSHPAEALCSSEGEDSNWIEHLLQYRTVLEGVPLLKKKKGGKKGGKPGGKTEVGGLSDGQDGLTEEMKTRAKALWAKVMWPEYNGKGGSTKPFERSEMQARRTAMISGDKNDIPTSIRSKLINFEKELGPPGIKLCAYCGAGFKPDPNDPEKGPKFSFDTNCGGGHIWTECPYKEAGKAEAAAQQARGRAARNKRKETVGGVDSTSGGGGGGSDSPQTQSNYAKCSVPLENLDSDGKLKPDLRNDGEACTVAGLEGHYVGDIVFAGLSTNHKCGLKDATHPTVRQIAALSKSRGVELVFDPNARLERD
eukprot:COSAG06_NODE_4301_length_4383_cov_3.244164_2_plen_484_part_01